MSVLKRTLILITLLFCITISSPLMAQEVTATQVEVTFDADVLKLGTSTKEMQYSVKHGVIAEALVKGGYDTVGKVAKADLGKLATLIGKTKSVIKGKSVVTPNDIHGRAALELAARLKDAAMNTVLSGGTTMLEGANEKTKIAPEMVGRVFLNPSRTYKQLPDKYNM